MGFRNGAFARVIKLTVGDKSTRASISIRDKNSNGEFEESFYGTCFFIGKAKEMAADLQRNEMIRLISVDVSRTVKDEQINYFFKCWEFEFFGRKVTKLYDTPNKDNTIPTPLF